MFLTLPPFHTITSYISLLLLIFGVSSRLTYGCFSTSSMLVLLPEPKLLVEPKDAIISFELGCNTVGAFGFLDLNSELLPGFRGYNFRWAIKFPSLSDRLWLNLLFNRFEGCCRIYSGEFGVRGDGGRSSRR